jgi:hypothetical protein
VDADVVEVALVVMVVEAMMDKDVMDMERCLPHHYAKQLRSAF